MNYDENIQRALESHDLELVGVLRELQANEGLSPSQIAAQKEVRSLRVTLAQQQQQFLAQLFTARRHQRLTQQELAEKAGIAQSTIARIELGKTNPGLKTLIRLAHILDVQLTLQASN